MKYIVGDTPISMPRFEQIAEGVVFSLECLQNEPEHRCPILYMKVSESRSIGDDLWVYNAVCLSSGRHKSINPLCGVTVYDGSFKYQKAVKGTTT